GYEVSFEQDKSLQGTALYSMYAIRPLTGRATLENNGAVAQAAWKRGWTNPASLLRDLQSFLTERLPGYMVAADFVLLGEMALTPNGKLDAQALPAPGGKTLTARQYEAPLGEIETTLAQLWAELLRVERVGRYDNFFGLGGHSLLAVRLI